MIDLNKEQSDDELKQLDENLKNANIDRESKIIIHKKMVEHDEKLNTTMEMKGKELEEKLNPPKKK